MKSEEKKLHLSKYVLVRREFVCVCTYACTYVYSWSFSDSHVLPSVFNPYGRGITSIKRRFLVHSCHNVEPVSSKSLGSKIPSFTTSIQCTKRSILVLNKVRSLRDPKVN